MLCADRVGLPPPSSAHFRGALDWFDAELDLPERFHLSTNPHAHGKALSWFKPEATDHIRQARIILAVMVQYGIPSEMVTTSRPGYVVYEDDHQICAIPFRDAR